MTRYHPWRALRDLGPSWRLRWRDDLDDDTYGFTEHRTRTIHMRTGLSFEERRCTIAHEVQHVHRGPVPEWQDLREEASIDRHVARLLVPSARDLADALVFHHGDFEETATDLWVDPWMLEVRLGTLLGTEHTYLRRRLAEVELLRIDG